MTLATSTLDQWSYSPAYPNEEAIASITARADVVVSRGRRGIRFRIPRRILEEQSGIKLREGRIYDLAGEVEGICGFHTFRIGTRLTTIYLHLPKQHLEKVVSHGTYNVRFFGLREMELSPGSHQVIESFKNGTNYSLLAKIVAGAAYHPKGPMHEAVSMAARVYRVKGRTRRFRFDLWRPKFERITGITLEQGLTYTIRGKIGEICGFEVQHEQTTTNQHVQIEVPKASRHRFEHGETYELIVESVSKKQTILSEKEIRMRDVWDWVLIAAWIDTEGSYIANASRSTYSVIITQKEKAPLIGICGFLRTHGIACTVRRKEGVSPMDSSKKCHAYYLDAWGPEGLAKIIQNTEPYIRTQNKRRQIERCKRELAAPRKRLEEKVIRARMLLGLVGQTAKTNHRDGA